MNNLYCEILNEIKSLNKAQLANLLFDYSNYVIKQLEEGNQPCCAMEYYMNDWEN